MTEVDPIFLLDKWELFALAQANYLIVGSAKHPQLNSFCLH